MGINVKPCPFCGTRVHVVYSRPIKRFIFRHEFPKKCFIDDLFSVDCKDDNFKTAIEKWNSRYNEK